MSDAAFRYVLSNPPHLATVSGRVQTLTGYDPDAFLSSHVDLRDRIHPTDLPLFDSLVSSANARTSGEFNLRLRHADGKIRCIKGYFTKSESPSSESELELQFADARTVHEPGDAVLLSAFKTLIELTTDYIYIKNRNHVILAASSTLPSLTESTKDQTALAGTTDYDNHSEVAADEYYRLEEQAFAEGKRVNQIQHVKTQDGKTRWIDNRKYPIGGPAGEIIGLLGVAPDITEAFETHKKLLESEEWLRDAQEIAGLSSYILDIPQRKWIISSALAALLGIGDDDDRAFDRIWPLIHPDDRPAMARRFEGYFSGELNSFDSEYRIVRHTDGAVRWVHTRGRLERDAQGKPLVLRGTVQDITERKQTETILRESEATLREAQEIAGLANFVFDIEGGTWEGSDNLEEMLGIDATYPRTMEGWVSLVHPEQREVMSGWLAKSIAAREAGFSYEYRIVRPSDGAVRWLKGMARIEYSAAGKATFLRGTLQDITDSKRAEMALRENEHLLREAQRIAGVGSYVFDIASGVWRSSEVLNEIFGIDRGYGTTVEGWLALVHPAERAAMTKYLQDEVLHQGKPFEMEYRIVRPSDGEVRWVFGRGELTLDADGRPIRMQGVIQDITERKRAEAALLESSELLRLFVEHAPVALAMFDREMRYLAVSHRWLENYGMLDREVLGHSHYELIPDIPERWKEAHRRGLAGETLKADEDRFERADGRVQWIEWEIVPWGVGNGHVGGIVLFADDITARKQAEERLQLAASVFTGAREGITITDLKGTILDVNDAFTRITGYTREEVLGKNPRLLKSGLQSREFYEKMWSAIHQTGHWSGEIWNRSKNGDIFAETLEISTIFDSNRQPSQYMALFSDITELKRHEQQLQHIAHYDPLTGLPNRVLFTNRLRQAMAQTLRTRQMLAVAYFDLDGFKAINDKHGHSVGDALLTAIAFKMRRVMREGDTLGRLGGDEFAAVLLDVANPESIAPALKRMLAAAAEEVQIGEVDLRLSACCGVTYYPQPEEVDADVLLRQAGQAMYQAKLAGKNRSHTFNPSEDLIARSRHENLQHIRNALEARQFILHYQPKVNMRTGKIVGVEALLRWQHPQRGLLPPGMFLPIVEDDPLIIDIGEWVIETALAQMEMWQAAGFDLPVSVNLSALELQQPDFADRLRTRLAAHPLVKPSSLELEILETSALEDVVQTSHVLLACRELGVSIALDDFGIGYSSLTYLKRLPANVLKIDQSFVRDMLDDPENLNILEGVMGLAAAFRREVIAEGVETLEHGLMLLQMGCETGQGYGIARPMPASDVQAWAATWRPDPRWAEVPPVRADNRSVLYACVEHHAWLSAFEACLLGKRSSPPPLDADRCRVSLWLDSEKQTARGTLATVRAIESLHRELHVLASEILASQTEGPSEEGLVRLQHLHRLHEKCMSRLRSFTRPASGRRARRRGAQTHRASHQ